MLEEKDYNWLRKTINDIIKLRWKHNVFDQMDGMPCFTMGEKLVFTRDFFWNKDVTPPQDKIGKLTNEEYKGIMEALWLNNKKHVDMYMLEFLHYHVTQYNISASTTPVAVSPGVYNFYFIDIFTMDLDKAYKYEFKVL